jgi:predicted RNase H-like HicB family nuclease
MSRDTYEVRAERSGKWWALSVPQLPGAFSQVRRLDQAESMARDLIATFLDVAPASFDITVDAKLDEDTRATVDNVLDLRSRIEAEERVLADMTRKVAQKLVADEGMTVRDVGRVLHVSYQRIAQIVPQAASRSAVDRIGPAGGELSIPPAGTYKRVAATGRFVVDAAGSKAAMRAAKTIPTSAHKKVR